MKLVKVTILKRCFIGGGGNNMPGDEVDLDERLANRLIASGIAEAKKAAPKKKATPKKSNRAVTELTTPEDED